MNIKATGRFRIGMVDLPNLDDKLSSMPPVTVRRSVTDTPNNHGQKSLVIFDSPICESVFYFRDQLRQIRSVDKFISGKYCVANNSMIVGHRLRAITDFPHFSVWSSRITQEQRDFGIDLRIYSGRIPRVFEHESDRQTRLGFTEDKRPVDSDLDRYPRALASAHSFVSFFEGTPLQKEDDRRYDANNNKSASPLPNRFRPYGDFALGVVCLFFCCFFVEKSFECEIGFMQSTLCFSYLLCSFFFGLQGIVSIKNIFGL